MAPSSRKFTLKKNKLGSSGVLVTEVCLGTMTWGLQNTEADAHAQLDYAIKERGVNFLDTAEIYPAPVTAPQARPGTTEEYIGTWLAKNPKIRSSVVIATKVCGRKIESRSAAYRTIPPTEPYPDARLDPASILLAAEASLRRLQTDYIDVYQLHWPDRYVPLWGKRSYDPTEQRDSIPFVETVRAMQQLIDTGKIRHWGVSNETTFGICELVKAADSIGCPRPVSIQNQFCLLNRQFEAELAEACAPSHYDVGLLPWSVLGGGALSGKYIGKIDGNRNVTDPSMAKSRFALFKFYQDRFLGPQQVDIINKYDAVAREAGISLATMAQKWCATRWYIPSTIIGATTMEQLKENINALGVGLPEHVLKKIDEIHESCKDPCASVL